MSAAGETIFALSSGSPPAAIAVVRISGPKADAALRALTGKLSQPRRATVARIRNPASGELIDEGLVLYFPGPGSATGEDLAELHLHGGRAVVAEVLRSLADMDGLRSAEPGEFTRRAFENGRIDLAEAEGLADLLEAETEAQRRSALAMAGGALSRKVEEWQRRLLDLAAQVEAALDFSDEGDVGQGVAEAWWVDREALEKDMREWLQRPAAERLKDGIRVVFAGPTNAGKSSLFNYIAGREAAIISPSPGTTRDVLEAPTSIGGTPFVLIDTAGLRESDDEIEAIGMERARQSVAEADLILWLGAEQDRPSGHSIVVQSKIDEQPSADNADIGVSARTGEGVAELIALIRDRARELLPRTDEVAINRRQRELLADAVAHIEMAAEQDLLLAAEELRLARAALDMITGRAGVEQMLDALFGRFCIGK